MWQKRPASVQGKQRRTGAQLHWGCTPVSVGAASIYTLCFLTQKQMFCPLPLASQPGRWLKVFLGASTVTGEMEHPGIFNIRSNKAEICSTSGFILLCWTGAGSFPRRQAS